MSYSPYQDNIDRERYAGHTFMEDESGNLLRAENGSPLFYEPYNPNSGLKPYYQKVTVQQPKPVVQTQTIIKQPIYYPYQIKVVPYTCAGYPLCYSCCPNCQINNKTQEMNKTNSNIPVKTEKTENKLGGYYGHLARLNNQLSYIRGKHAASQKRATNFYYSQKNQQRDREYF